MNLDASQGTPIQLVQMSFRRSINSLLFMALLFGGCLRTHDGGCGGPRAGSRCECTNDGGPALSAVSQQRPVVTEATPSGGTVIVHADVEPPHLMFLLRPDAWCERIVVHDVYEALLRRDPFSHQLQPELAETYDVSEDGLELTFHLRQGVEWHDGEPFSADDVLFTFDTVRDPAVLAPTARANLEPIESYEALDESTFRIRLREPSFLLLQHLESLTIIPRHIFGQGDLNTHSHLRRPVGTGPFRVTAFRSGREVVLERNDDYWGVPARLDRVIYRFARDRTLALQMLRRGDVDILPRMTNAQVEQVRDDAELLETQELQSFIAPGFSFLVYNTQRPEFSDPRVRRAITMLIDRQTILCALEGCLGEIIGSPFPVHHPGIDPELEPLPFDPARARALLDEAGWRSPGAGDIRSKNGRPFNVTLLVPTISTAQQRIATFIQQDFRRAGIRLDIHNVDWAVFLQRIQDHDFDIAGLQFTLDWETDYYVLYHSSQAEGGMNYGAWSNEEADQVLDALRRELDRDRRVELQRRLHRVLAREQPHTFMFARVMNIMTHRSIGNAVPGIPWFDERTWYIPPEHRDERGRPTR